MLTVTALDLLGFFSPVLPPQLRDIVDEKDEVLPFTLGSRLRREREKDEEKRKRRK